MNMNILSSFDTPGSRLDDHDNNWIQANKRV
jgi:hypothetical protein